MLNGKEVRGSPIEHFLISSTKRSWDEVLSLYRKRDEVEKKFDDLKNELEVMPLRVQKLATLQGLLFIFFLSLVLRAMLLRRARIAKLLEKSSIEEIPMEMAKIRAVNIGGKWRLTEISKKQRTILEKMEIAILVEANLVIREAGFRVVSPKPKSFIIGLTIRLLMRQC